MSEITYNIQYLGKIQQYDLQEIKDILEVYLLTETRKLDILTLYCPVNAIQQDLIELYPARLDYLGPNSYLLSLKKRNIIFIQSFYYFLMGRVDYTDTGIQTCYQKRATIYNLFKKQQDWASRINTEYRINSDSHYVRQCPSFETDIMHFKGNTKVISDIIREHNLSTRYFPIKYSNELSLKYTCVTDFSDYLFDIALSNIWDF